MEKTTSRLNGHFGRSRPAKLTVLNWPFWPPNNIQIIIIRELRCRRIFKSKEMDFVDNSILKPQQLHKPTPAPRPLGPQRFAQATLVPSLLKKLACLEAALAPLAALSVQRNSGHVCPTYVATSPPLRFQARLRRTACIFPTLCSIPLALLRLAQRPAPPPLLRSFST